MNYLDEIQQILQNPRIAYYIVAVQIPIVLCLAIQSYQAYKLGFKDFKFIYLAWVINLFYLIIKIFINKAAFGDEYKLIIRTSFDLLNTYFIFIAVKDSFNQKILFRLKEIPKKYIAFVFLLAGLVKIIPGSTHIIPYIHLRYAPVAFIDLFVLFLLALYFQKLFKQFRQTKWLFGATLLYSGIQILSVIQRDQIEPNLILHVDNIGFAFGLFSKIIILISLSILMVSAVKTSIIEEKELLLKKISLASKKIIDIETPLFANFQDRENSILKIVLNEILHIMNKDLGFYSSYNEKSRLLEIKYTSEFYNYKIGYEYKDEIGISGKAVRLKKAQRMNALTDTPEYVHFESLPDKNDLDKNVNSAIAIPLILDDQVIGVYMIECEQENCFSELDVFIVTSLIKQATIAIKNIHLISDSEISKGFLESLRQIDKEIVHQHLDLKTILTFILKKSLLLVKEESGNIDLVADNQKLICFASTNLENINKELDINDSYSGLAVKEGKTQYFKDLDNVEERYRNLYKDVLGKDYKCELIVPLIVNNVVIGIFNTESKEVNKFNLDDINKIEGYAGQAAIAIYVAKLIDDIKKNRDSLSALVDIELVILNSNQGLLETLEAIIRKGLELIRKEHGEILLLDKDEQGNEHLTIKKSTVSSEEGKSFPLKSICGLAINKSSIIYLPNIDKTEESTSNLNETLAYIPSDNERKLYVAPHWGRMKSELVLPLILKDKVIGVFNIECAEYNSFSSDEITVLKNLANAAAIAIHNAQQFEEISTKNIALANSVDKKNIEMTINLGNLISHRIGNEVGYIKTTLKNEFLAGDYGTFNKAIEGQFEEMLKCAERAVQASEQVSETVKELLLSTLKPIDFSEVKLLIEKKENFNLRDKIKIEILGLEGMKYSLGNLSLLMEIFFEFISNSIKSMPKGGKILIVGKSEKNDNIIIFKDQGCGIPKDSMEQIFVKGWSKWKDNNRGGGIGLYEVKLLINAWGGKVEVESAINVGTTFTVRLPIFETNN